MTTVGIVGTGRMGAAMARSLAAHRFDLVVHNRSREKAEEVARESGARVVDTAAEAASRSDVVITMLADDDAVRAVYRGAGGLAEGLRPDAIAVDMGTVLPSTKQWAADVAASCGARFLDVPVSGSVFTAERGQLTLMAGGEAADLERARPVLEAIGSPIFHLGPVGAGAAMKLAVNAVIYGLNEALSEAIVLAESSGIPRSLAWDVLGASAVAAPYVGYKRQSFLDPDAAPTAFALRLAEKDLRLILALAAEADVPMPQTRTNLEVMNDADVRGLAEADLSAVARHLRAQVPA